MRKSGTYICLLALCAVSACTGSKTHDGSIGSWQVMTSSGKGEKLCYAGASPASSKGSIRKSDRRPYFMVTKRPSGKIEISASSDYPYMFGSKVELAAGGKAYSLFFKDAVAWARNDADDKAIIGAMKVGQDIEVRGVSQAGTTSIDAYSSRGFAEALMRVKKLCQ